MNQITAIQLHGEFVATVGNVDLLKRHKQGVLCSRKCPADKILEAYDRFKVWAGQTNLVVVSGFHSPVEQECLRLLLTGRANIIFYAAREIESLRISRDWKQAIEEERMLILSSSLEKRATRRSTHERNKRVMQLSDTLYVPFASPGGLLAQVVPSVSPQTKSF